MPEPKDPNNAGPDPDSGDKGKPPKTPNLMSRGVVSWMLLGGLMIALLLMFKSQQQRPMDITWPEFMSFAEQGSFEDKVVIESSRVVGKLKESVAGTLAEGAPGGRVAVVINAEAQLLFIAELREIGQPFEINTGSGLLLHMLISWGPFFLIAFLIYFFVFRSLRNAGGGPGMLGNFGRSRHKVVNKEHSTVTLQDVAGVDEAKDEIGEIIEFLKNPKKFQRLGGRVPRGVLLIGLPGCGKTLLA